MRDRLTKKSMGLNDSPTTMTAPHPNPPVEKYETGNPDSWAETPNMNRPWDEENAAGREPSGHAKMKTYAHMVHEAKELEAKALRCLKMAELMLPEAPVDVIERQAVDYMTMSNKSVLSTLRRIREFEDNINEARIAKIVDAVLNVVSEEEEEEEEETKKKCAEEEEEEEEEEKVKKAEEEEEEEEGKGKKAEEEEEEEEDKKNEMSKDKIAAIVEAVLDAIATEEEEEEEEKGKKAEEEVKPEEKKEDTTKVEEKQMTPPEVKAEEVKPLPLPAQQEQKPEYDKKESSEVKKSEEEPKEKIDEITEKVEEKKGNLDISFDDLNEVMASKEDEAILAQLFKAAEEEEEEEEKEEVKPEQKVEAKIKTLKNVTASKGNSEIEKLSSLWRKD